ncbi:carbohydrate porin [Ideonella sp.]|uniref:carbohydrate porin n=1 Tax=Ideonella sp. TaxID=1929293 RepID=UPI002B461D34|nr:carbohydrate porin [Ideonella sp.]HJV67632.1 carbohydrate porin [Ideonella sp.]
MGPPRALPVVAVGLVLTVGLYGGTAQAAADDTAQLEARLAEVMQRLQQLEQRNRVLEQRLDAAQAQADGVERALASDRLSENEPELVTRLKAVENQTLSMQKPARQIEALEDINASASLVGMVQHVGEGGGEAGHAQSRANYRGDIALALPGGALGSADGRIFTQLRFGQGAGIAARPGFSSTPNTTAFEIAGVDDPDSSFAILAQAWYQLEVPLPLDGFKPHARQHLELNVGKIDPFLFFDQNAAADDEGTRFVNNVFVHNPLLDSGGDVGADAYGFTPGLRLAWRDEADAALRWRASLGVFGSGEAANFSGSLGRPFVIAQLEASPRWIQGLDGTYRLYAWHNGRATELDGTAHAHAGWGISADQRVTASMRLFGRYGRRTTGHGGFDQALTLGGELAGEAWSRAADGVGLAFAWLPASRAWREATAADQALIGTAASGAERVAELYYRWHLNGSVELTPDLQWVGRPAANPQASGYFVAGLRARLGF